MEKITARLHRAARSGLMAAGYNVKRRSSDEELAQFISMIRAHSSGCELIRLGSAGDGGYLVPDDFAGVAACFSPGVADTSDFESAIAAKGIPCFLADFSVEGPAVSHPLLDFERKFLGGHDDDTYMTLGSWIEAKVPRDGDLILQMDIEGSEYDVLMETTQETLSRFRIIIVEFHNLESLCDPFGLRLLSATFRKLTHAFDIVHMHPNNWVPPIRCGSYEIAPMVEFTFLRRDRVPVRGRPLRIPHELDRANDPAMPDFPLPSTWLADDPRQPRRAAGS